MRRLVVSCEGNELKSLMSVWLRHHGFVAGGAGVEEALTLTGIPLSFYIEKIIFLF